MTDAELIARLREIGKHSFGWTADQAADRIEALIAENKRLGQQCEGLMQAGMNNGQALILTEAKLAQAVEALDCWGRMMNSPAYDIGEMVSEFNAIARTTLAEIKLQSSEFATQKGESHD